ncbi:MAG TPA: M13 family metallopeptidase N-terminal domain-containing protein, partial [Kofleriaceae bacterium]|nr:M13 family metallopeptidase N-terminal domain-containing protein [Kofleriaceae bacterium]
MKKTLLAATLATVAACGSSTQPATAPSETEAPPAAAPPATATPPATPAPTGPEIGAWGFDAAGMDKNVAPGASFYQFANGTWLKTTKLPADKSNYGMFTVLSDRSDERTRQIVESAGGAAGSETQKIKDYYRSFMDEATIESKGITPLKARMDQINAISDARGLLGMLAINSRERSDTPLATIVGQDDRDPDHYIANIRQGGLGLPDRDMYDAKKKQFEPLREGYKKYLRDMLSLAGIEDADKRAAAIYALEEKIAAAHWTREQNRDAKKTYNKMTIAQLEKKAPGVEWKVWLEGVGLSGATAVNVNQPPAIARISKL